ncbi:hypothetical protein ACS0PU_004364 [Formica fusca]
MCNRKTNENNTEKKRLQKHLRYLLFISEHSISSNERKSKKEIHNNTIHFPRNNSYRDETRTQLRIEARQ